MSRAQMCNGGRLGARFGFDNSGPYAAQPMLRLHLTWHALPYYYVNSFIKKCWSNETRNYYRRFDTRDGSEQKPYLLLDENNKYGKSVLLYSSIYEYSATYL